MCRGRRDNLHVNLLHNRSTSSVRAGLDFPPVPIRNRFLVLAFWGVSTAIALLGKRTPESHLSTGAAAEM
jgi:hypothetical protein